MRLMASIGHEGAATLSSLSHRLYCRLEIRAPQPCAIMDESDIYCVFGQHFKGSGDRRIVKATSEYTPIITILWLAKLSLVSEKILSLSYTGLIVCRLLRACRQDYIKPLITKAVQSGS